MTIRTPETASKATTIPASDSEIYHQLAIQKLADLRSVNLTRVGDLIVHISDSCVEALRSGAASLDLRLDKPETTPTIVLGYYTGRLSIGFKSSNAGIVLERCAKINLQALFYRNGLLKVGIGTSINSCEATIFDATISIGEDCMMSHGVVLQPSDQHDIYDTTQNSIINTKRSITIGKHVWLGKESYIGAGVTIGDNSIVGARSVVVSNVPKGTLVAGNPARILRTEVAWTRKFAAEKDESISNEAVRDAIVRDYLS